MSAISSLLLLILLCVSVYECYARHLGAVGKEPETKSLLPFKNDEKIIPEAAIGEGMAEISSVDEHKPLSSSLKAKKMKSQEGGDMKTSSGVAPEAVSQLSYHVSWHLPVPPKKRNEEQPGFNLDYEHPKTHPPIHN